MSVAPDTTVVRAGPLPAARCRNWPSRGRPEVPAEPELLLLGEALATDPPGPGLAARPRRAALPDRQPRADRRGPGRAGLRRPPVRQLRPAPRRRPRTAARRDRRRRRAVARRPPQGFRRTRSPAAATGWRRSGRCCAVRGQRAMHALGIPTHPLAGRGGHRPGRCSATPCCPRPCADPDRRRSPAGRQLPVRGGERRPELLRRLADRDRPPPSRRATPSARTSPCSRPSSPRRQSWWRSGCCRFVHGVMNTDNMTISGETIDYGPCAFAGGL